MYNPKSMKAEEFISHEEILDTLRYAEENKDNLELVDSILEKAREMQGALPPGGVGPAGLRGREPDPGDV